MTARRLKIALIAIAVALASVPIRAQLFDEDPDLGPLLDLREQSETELREALDRYSSALAAIENEKLELVRQTNALEESVVALKERDRRLQLQMTSREQHATEAEESLAKLQGQADYIDGVLSEYVNQFESRIHPAERQTYLDSLVESRELIAQVDLGYDEQIAEQIRIVLLGLDRLESSIGGREFAGKALSPAGKLEQGRFVTLGPNAYFAPDAPDAPAGIAQYNTGTIEPRIVPLPGSAKQEIASLIDSGKGQVALDVTQGKALSLQEEQGNLWTHIQKGGWVGYVILGLGALACVLVVLKVNELVARSPKPTRNVGAIAADSVTDPADRREWESPLARNDYIGSMLREGVKHARENRALMEEAMLSVILEYKLRMERFLPFLAVTAATAPLLGLLGTVVGMIKTFTLITVFGTGDAKSLSGGISEALITTELGLVVAIPTLIAHSMLLRRVRRNTDAMEKIAFDFVKALPAETAETNGRQAQASV